MASNPEAAAPPAYEADWFAWTQDQASRLRALAELRPNEPLDWEHLAEEVEDLGRSERHACESLVEQVIAHLLKLEHSTAGQPRDGWETEITAARIGLGRKLTPSLRRFLGETLDDHYRLAVKLLASAAKRHEPELLTRLPERCPYTLDQILGDWWPDPKPT